MIEINSPYEARQFMASNFVCLEPGKIVMSTGNEQTQEKLEKAGIEVITVDVSELQKGWGGVHCMTGFLRRDSL